MRTVAEWLDAARQHGSLGAAALHWQAHERGEDPSVPLALMHGRLRVMRESAQAGLSPTLRSVSGMVGGQAALLAQSPFAGRFRPGGPGRASTRSPSRSTSLHGQNRAAPTAAAAGTLPGALLAAQEAEGFSDDELVMALFAAAAIGRAIALQATISGAEGGCPGRMRHGGGHGCVGTHPTLWRLPGGGGARLCLCADEYAGPGVRSRGRAGEVPCVYRNVGGVSQAVSAAQLGAFGRGLPHPPGRDDSHHARCRRRHAFLAA